jgi:hypothetical protein
MTNDQLFLEIETTRVRQEWAMSEIERAGGSPSLEKYLADLSTELVALRLQAETQDAT